MQDAGSAENTVQSWETFLFAITALLGAYINCTSCFV